MPSPIPPLEDDSQDGQDLVLTPAKLRLNSTVVVIYSTATWLTHAVFLALLMIKVSSWTIRVI